jgi:Lhr-like helicase
VKVAYEFIGNFSYMGELKNNVEFYKENSGNYKEENFLSREERDENSVKMGCSYHFVHDARSAILTLQYIYEKENFPSYVGEIISLFEYYLSQVQDFFDNGKVSTGYFIRRVQSSNKVYPCYALYVFDLVGVVGKAEFDKIIAKKIKETTM